MVFLFSQNSAFYLDAVKKRTTRENSVMHQELVLLHICQTFLALINTIEQFKRMCLLHLTLSCPFFPDLSFFKCCPLATVTSSSENEERCGSSLEWGKDGGGTVRDSSHHAAPPPPPPLPPPPPPSAPVAIGDSSAPSEAQSQPRTAPAAPSPSDGPEPYHSTSLVLPRPNSVAG